MSSVELNTIPLNTVLGFQIDWFFWAKFDRWLEVPESCVISVILGNWWKALHQFKTRQDKIRQDVLFKASSTLIRFQMKTELFCSGYISSTLQRRKRSPKTEPFENALQSGAIWKRCSLKTLFSSVNGENDAIWKRWRHQNRHDRAPDHSTVSVQYGGQTLTCGFNFAPISLADILKCACVEFIWACALRV